MLSRGRLSALCLFLFRTGLHGAIEEPSDDELTSNKFFIAQPLGVLDICLHIRFDYGLRDF